MFRLSSARLSRPIELELPPHARFLRARLERTRSEEGWRVFGKNCSCRIPSCTDPAKRQLTRAETGRVSESATLGIWDRESLLSLRSIRGLYITVCVIRLLFANPYFAVGALWNRSSPPVFALRSSGADAAWPRLVCISEARRATRRALAGSRSPITSIPSFEGRARAFQHPCR